VNQTELASTGSWCEADHDWFWFIPDLNNNNNNNKKDVFLSNRNQEN